MDCGCKAGEDQGHGMGGPGHGPHHGGPGGVCTCGCHGGGMLRPFVSRAKRVRILEEMKEDLKDQIVAIDEEIAELKKHHK